MALGTPLRPATSEELDGMAEALSLVLHNDPVMDHFPGPTLRPIWRAPQPTGSGA